MDSPINKMHLNPLDITSYFMIIVLSGLIYLRQPNLIIIFFIGIMAMLNVYYIYLKANIKEVTEFFKKQKRTLMDVWKLIPNFGLFLILNILGFLIAIYLFVLILLNQPLNIFLALIFWSYIYYFVYIIFLLFILYITINKNNRNTSLKRKTKKH